MVIANHSSHFYLFQLQCHGFLSSTIGKENVKRIHKPWSIIMYCHFRFKCRPFSFHDYHKKSSSVCQSNQIHFVCTCISDDGSDLFFFPFDHHFQFDLMFVRLQVYMLLVALIRIYQVIECIEINSMWQRSLAADSTQFSVSNTTREKQIYNIRR